jgi:two-component system, NarL family, invasion response regulator UvrY
VYLFSLGDSSYTFVCDSWFFFDLNAYLMNILIVDDHVILREGVKQIIKILPKITLIDEAGDGKDAFLKVCKNHYDLVIMDISMPGMTGLDVLQGMKDRNNKTLVLIFSFYPQEQYALRAFKMGAAGYLTKDCLSDELVLAIRRILSGGKYISVEMAERLLELETDSGEKSLHHKLSDREFQVMIKLAKGKSVTEIANEIFISVKTVSTYRKRIMEKMHFNNDVDLIIYALKHNFTESTLDLMPPAK